MEVKDGLGLRVPGLGFVRVRDGCGVTTARMQVLGVVGLRGIGVEGVHGA